ncbi:tRNA(Ile)-lysidine synthetase [hydrothermal vent metagenome]|uniref:tRNA(Ile)-lysidine synthetase n=1 Tax=hydrothermal vent metagenome TaxID=652676 RepID=A0A3B0SWV2_9ZZZZ
MLNEFKIHLKNNFSELSQTHFLLACSGGLDSVVLTHLSNQCKLNFSLAHCNFQLRGPESDADQEFVVELARGIRKKLYVTNFNTNNYINKYKVSVEMAARELRYAWFAELMSEHNIKTLVTAHHADDNLETFLINLSRGTGIDGLKGIPVKTDTIARPLLAFSRVRILAYANAENLKWREDSTNVETVHLRNKIRHNIVPLLKELHPTFLANFGTTQSFLSDTSLILDNHVKNLKSRLFVAEERLIRIPLKELSELHPQKAYLHALFRDYGFTAWGDILDLLSAMSGKEVRSKTHRLVKDRAHLLLTELGDNKSECYQIPENLSEMDNPVKLVIEDVEKIDETSKNILYIDKEALKYPLIVRKWKKGDYFCPFGMKGRKKLSKFFKDEKIDVISKEQQWLLCSENNIVWVIGKRPDNRFKVTKDTKNILKFTLYK